MISVLAAAPDLSKSLSILGGGVLALYAASLFLSFALARRDGGSPTQIAGRRAIGQWLPIAAVVLGAVLLRRADVAIGVLFATSVTCLSLLMGVITYLSPLNPDASTRRVWLFLLPAALLPLMAGFSGEFSLLHATVFAIMGLAIGAVWADPANDPPVLEQVPTAKKEIGTLRLYLFIVGIILAGCGSYFAIAGTIDVSSASRWLPVGVLAAALLGPMLTISVTSFSSTGASGESAVSIPNTLVGIVLLNLCLLLPASIVLWHVMPGVTDYTRKIWTPAEEVVQATTAPSPSKDAPLTLVETVVASAAPMPYPAVVWRIDTIFLILIGAALIPVAVGRWTIGPGEAGGLIIGYGVYLALITGLSRRY